MQNPILQMLSGNRLQNQNSMSSRIQLAKDIVAGKDPNQVCNMLMKSNPQFKKFIEENEKKSIKEIAMEYDLDLDMIKKFI